MNNPKIDWKHRRAVIGDIVYNVVCGYRSRRDYRDAGLITAESVGDARRAVKQNKGRYQVKAFLIEDGIDWFPWNKQKCREFVHGLLDANVDSKTVVVNRADVAEPGLKLFQPC